MKWTQCYEINIRRENLPISDHRRSGEAGVSNSLPADEEAVHAEGESEVGPG